MAAELALVAIRAPLWAGLVEPPLTDLAQSMHRRMAEQALDLL